jgi:glutathione S-transferase
MALTLHSHPLSSYCWKALIALYEIGAEFDLRLVNFGDPESRSAFLALWPTGKIPLLVDGPRVIPESTIIIEYLDRSRPGALLPSDGDACLEARLWDRLFDQYVMTPVQMLVGDQLRPSDAKDPLAQSTGRTTLSTAYDLIEHHMKGRQWAAGDQFSLADCAAAPALFYGTTIVPLPDRHANLTGYFERLVRRPSVARTIVEARPYFHFYPLHDAIAPRFVEPHTAKL